MIATLSGALIVQAGEEAESLRTSLAFPNPAYRQALRMREQGRKVPLPSMVIQPCLDVEHNSRTWVLAPRCASWKGSLADARTSPVADLVSTTLALRPYQQRALESWVKADREGVIVAPCGAGKTMVGLAAICATPTPALVLVHTLDLAKQWVERAKGLGIEAALISDGRAPVVARVVVATIQTLVTWDFWQRLVWAKNFGLTVLDEAHHVPAETWGQVALSLPGAARLALTATPRRADGLTDLIHLHVGATVAEITPAELQEVGATMAPGIWRIDTGWTCSTEGAEWTAMLTEMLEDEDRQRTLFAIARELLSQGRQVLILTERVPHAEATALALGGIAIHARLPKKARAAAMAGLSNGTIRCAVATQLADEGLDVPGLDALILAVPCTQAGRLEQRVGRAMRAHPGKQTPIVVDLVDAGRLAGLWFGRSKVYRKLGATLVDPTVRMAA